VAEALQRFGTGGFEAVGVGELAAAAGVTTGSLYHHFGSKLGLYSAVRTDVERRLLDRLEGAAAVAPREAFPQVLLVGFDYVLAAAFAGMLAEQHPAGGFDPVQAFLAEHMDRNDVPVSRVLVAAWRAALRVAEDDPSGARRALLAVVRPDPPI